MRHIAQPTFLDTVRRPIIASRWVLIVAATLETALLVERRAVGREAVAALLGLLAYNVAALFVASRVPLARRPTKVITALDLCFLAAACHVTGGVQSPFTAQLFLVIIRAALLDGLAGGVVSGLASALIAVLLSGSSGATAVQTRQEMAINFPLAGLFAGYLTDRLRAFYVQHEKARIEALEALSREKATQREMELARAMQESLIPRTVVTCPGMQVSARREFASEVGGDFHFLIREERRVGLVVGDVCGKGLPAALAATTIAHLLPWLRPLHNPRTAFCALNRDLFERLPEGSFATMLLVEISPDSREVRIWNAGHPPPLLWRASAQQARYVEHFDTMLGALPQWAGQPIALPLEAGDLLVLYSDGLIEARNPSRELFGFENLASVVAANAHRSPDDIADALLESARSWGHISDDVTIVVFRYTGCRCELSPMRHAETSQTKPETGKEWAHAHPLA